VLQSFGWPLSRLGRRCKAVGGAGSMPGAAQVTVLLDAALGMPGPQRHNVQFNTCSYCAAAKSTRWRRCFIPCSSSKHSSGRGGRSGGAWEKKGVASRTACGKRKRCALWGASASRCAVIAGGGEAEDTCQQEAHQACQQQQQQQQQQQEEKHSALEGAFVQLVSQVETWAGAGQALHDRRATEYCLTSMM